MRLIDADALGIGKANRDCFDDPKYADGWNSAIEIINNAPTIEAEPVRHGRWVEIKGMAPPEYHGKHRCSICCARALERKFHEELSEHCPNCGAKMDGDKHDTEG